MLDDRKLAILRAIVTDYVSSQEPVGSKALVERHNLDVSPATVRNDMAVLEEEGYITQPHTSAGRIPTDKGYRLFVDRLSNVKPLTGAEKRAITQFMAGALDVDDVVRRTVQLLAQITRQVAIVQYPVLSSMVIRHVEVLRLGADRGLVMCVSATGAVEQMLVALPPDQGGHEDLALVRGRLSELLVGATPREAVDRLTTFTDQLPPSASALAATIVAALLDIVTDDPGARVAVAGVPNLTRFGDQFETTVKPVLEALEEQVVLLRLLGEATSPADVTVRIGHENPYEPLHATSVVASGYGTDERAWATLGIVGPTRMDYPSAIASVRAVARYVGRFLAEG